jgi:site-specific DNA-methyltransferase (adenine-specific)
MDEPFANLIFADPPFNIGYKYDKYNDKVKSKNYIAWTKDWMTACKNVLKPDGSFYIAIGDEYAANVKIIADDLKLVMRNWIIWHYTFGQQMKKKFARSHTHILYFVKDKINFTFNPDAVRVISDRQRVYKDKRANPNGKMPDDVWDEYPRLCGTFEERTDFPCQMPESLLARIIRISSHERDWVLDPFSGSGTTAVVAHKLNRIYTGIEISKSYVKDSRTRIRQSEGLPVEGEGLSKWPIHADRELKWLYHENKVPDGQLRKNKALLTLFTTKLNDRLKKVQQYTPNEVTDRLEKLRKAGKLGALREERIRTK